MKPIEFSESNSKLLGGDPEVVDLPVWLNGDELGVISCWKLSWRDRLRGLVGKPVWLYVRWHTHPPLRLTTEYPFEVKEGCMFVDVGSWL